MVRPRCLCKRIEHISKVPILKQPVFHILKAVSAVQRCMANSLNLCWSPHLIQPHLTQPHLIQPHLSPHRWCLFPQGATCCYSRKQLLPSSALLRRYQVIKLSSSASLSATTGSLAYRPLPSSAATRSFALRLPFSSAMTTIDGSRSLRSPTTTTSIALRPRLFSAIIRPTGCLSSSSPPASTLPGGILSGTPIPSSLPATASARSPSPFPPSGGFVISPC